MLGIVRRRVVSRVVLAASLALASIATAVLVGAAAPVDATASGLPPWTGGLDLYRNGVYTVQKTWLWCTAADVQIIRNIADREADHSKSGQQRYFDYMRAHNRYAIPVSDGIDPAGWTAGLRHFIDRRYELYASRSFDSALRSAVTNLRQTGLPVAITVEHGNHAWIITGFTATADPAATTDFSVTSVRVVGPLWGLQSRTYGYDMKPDTKLTPKQLAGFFTPWRYTSVPMVYEHRWVSIQPVADPPAPASAAPHAPAKPREAIARVEPIPAGGAPAAADLPNPTFSPQPPAATVNAGPAAQDADSASSLWLVAPVVLGGTALAASVALRRRRRHGRG